MWCQNRSVKDARMIAAKAERTRPLIAQPNGSVHFSINKYETVELPNPLTGSL